MLLKVEAGESSQGGLDTLCLINNQQKFSSATRVAGGTSTHEGGNHTTAPRTQGFPSKLLYNGAGGFFGEESSRFTPMKEIPSFKKGESQPKKTLFYAAAAAEV